MLTPSTTCSMRLLHAARPLPDPARHRRCRHGADSARWQVQLCRMSGAAFPTAVWSWCSRNTRREPRFDQMPAAAVLSPVNLIEAVRPVHLILALLFLQFISPTPPAPRAVPKELVFARITLFEPVGKSSLLERHFDELRDGFTSR